ncbi:hypothetical protein P3T29_005978 [Kitasatospora sp. MAP5-34]|nr:hypothetical protein [Kitasatospora sp. MAP5-34]
MPQNDPSQALSGTSQAEDLGFVSSPPARALVTAVDGAKEGDPITRELKVLAKEAMVVLRQVSGE